MATPSNSFPPISWRQQAGVNAKLSAKSVTLFCCGHYRPNPVIAMNNSTNSVNVGAIAATTIYTVPSGKSAVILKIVIRNASGTFDQVTDPVFSIGWNSTDYNNVVASATYTFPTAATTYKVLTPIANEATVGTTGQTLKINVTTAATASTTCTVSVFGYLF